MDYDWGIDDVEAKPEPRAEREPLADGRHELQIMRVLQEQGRLIIALAHEDDRWAWVWFKPPHDAGWAKPIVASLATACGLSKAEWLATDPGDLVGRRVAAEVYQKVGKNGLTYVNVSKFHEAAPVKPAATKAPPRTAAQKDDARIKEQYADDIPF
jgi:hypothetical protein